MRGFNKFKGNHTYFLCYYWEVEFVRHKSIFRLNVHAYYMYTGFPQQGRSKLDNWGGGADIYIFGFCTINFFWNKLFLWCVNTNIWISAPPPSIIELATALHNARIFPCRRQNCVGEGSVSIAYIMQSFHKFIVSLFCLIPPMWATLFKLLVQTLAWH